MEKAQWRWIRYRWRRTKGKEGRQKEVCTLQIPQIIASRPLTATLSTGLCFSFRNLLQYLFTFSVPANRSKHLCTSVHFWHLVQHLIQRVLNIYRQSKGERRGDWVKVYSRHLSPTARFLIPSINVRIQSVWTPKASGITTSTWRPKQPSGNVQMCSWSAPPSYMMCCFPTPLVHLMGHGTLLCPPTNRLKGTGRLVSTKKVNSIGAVCFKHVRIESIPSYSYLHLIVMDHALHYCFLQGEHTTLTLSPAKLSGKNQKVFSIYVTSLLQIIKLLATNL